MSVLQQLAFAWRLLWRDARAGELRLIAVAVVVAVASVTTVGFFADRVQLALTRQANQLLGADLVISADRPLNGELATEAARRGLDLTRMARFPSMATLGTDSVLSEIKVVNAGYPLRGELRIADAPGQADRAATAIPEPGTVWVDERLLLRLSARIGDELGVGNSRLRIARLITREPDAAIGFINSGPRVLLNEQDLAATGLVQVGSRIRYRLLVAGATEAMQAFRDWLQPKLAPGLRVESIQDARPEIRSALERAEKFLGLAALLSVILAAVAIALTARRYLQRHLDTCALMRCHGASQRQVLGLFVMQFLWLGGAASATGALLGYAAQEGLALWLASLVPVELPPPGPLPGLQGLVTGLALLLGFAVPPIVALARVPTLRVLRRDIGLPDRRGVSGYALGALAITLLIVWKAGEWRMGLIVTAGFAAAMLVAALFAWGVLKLTSRLPGNGVSWRFGVANLRRRPLASVVQVVALGVGVMALLTLTLIRNDLLQLWQTSLPADAPNRFIVNIQSDQIPALKQFFAERRQGLPELHPMVRARLLKINERSVSPDSYSDDRARRLVGREFNLSWASRMQRDNRLVAGAWWDAPGGGAVPRADQFSMEDGIARALGVTVGDTLTYDAGGRVFSGTVTSLRKVDWDSFNVNFFVVAPPGLLEDLPVSYVSSFYLPADQTALLNALVKAFPNLLLIDVAQVIGQVQQMIGQVSRAVQFVFVFTLLSGLVVLYAALASTQDERLYQATVMRTLGAHRRQLNRANLAEFALIGAMAGVMAAAGANALGMVVAQRIINVDYHFSASVWIIGVLGTMAGVLLAGWLGTRRVLRTPPLPVLRELA